MKKKIYILTVLLTILLFPFISKAQVNYEDVVYLKNGSIIHGIIIEQIPNQSIKIQTRDGNVFVYKNDEIEKMTKENIPITHLENSSKMSEFKKSGFINLTEIFYCPGTGDVKQSGNNSFKNNTHSFGFKTVNGYQINQQLSLGLGIGIDSYKGIDTYGYQSLPITLLPITIDARATILKGQFSPVFNASVGFAIGLNDASGGLVINPSLGIKMYISKNIAYLFNVGYKWQAEDVEYTTTNYTNTYPYYTTTTTTYSMYYQFVTISTGFSF